MEYSLAESLSVAHRVAEILCSISVPYAIGGSIASSLHGFPRSTMDVDLVAALRKPHIPSLIDALGQDFYFSESAIEEAVLRYSSFNIIELKTMLKIDIFVGKESGSAQLERAQTITTDDGHTFAVVTAEDIVAEKLRWYRLGNEISERQWTDLLGVIEVQGDRLDLELLREQCALFLVTDLLDRALLEAKG